jgi:hypothetical protein
MRYDRWTDFLFTGLAIVPLALMLAGSLGLALMAFLILLFAACGCGVLERTAGAESGRAPAQAPRQDRASTRKD